MSVSRRSILLSLLPPALLGLAGCHEFPLHIGMLLLTFEIHQNGQQVHTFSAGIRDDASLAQRVFGGGTPFRKIA